MNSGGVSATVVEPWPEVNTAALRLAAATSSSLVSAQ
jgi:hypothetical protein